MFEPRIPQVAIAAAAAALIGCAAQAAPTAIIMTAQLSADAKQVRITYQDGRTAIFDLDSRSREVAFEAPSVSQDRLACGYAVLRQLSGRNQCLYDPQ